MDRGAAHRPRRDHASETLIFEGPATARGQGLPGQRERGRRAVARRHRPRAHAHQDLRRAGPGAEPAPDHHRGRVRPPRASRSRTCRRRTRAPASSRTSPRSRCCESWARRSGSGAELMHKSDGRILVTHVGSIPRPPVLRDLLVRQDRGEPVDAARSRPPGRAGGARTSWSSSSRRASTSATTASSRARAFPPTSRGGWKASAARAGGRSPATSPSTPTIAPCSTSGGETPRASANAPQAVAEVRYTDLAEAERECDLFAALRRRRATAVHRALHDGGLAGDRGDHPAERPLRLARAVRHGARPRAPEGVRADPPARLRAPARLPRPRDGARALLPGRLARPVPEDGRAARGRHQPGHRGDPRRRASGCTSAGGTTTAPTRTTCRWRRSCRSSTARRSARSPCRSPIRGTSTSTRCSSASRRPTACCSCPA